MKHYLVIITEQDNPIMKILYDYQIFNMQEYGGISRYYYEVIRYYSQEYTCEPLILAPVFINDYICHLKNSIVIGKKLPKIKKTYLIRKMVNILISNVLLSGFQADIIHATYYDLIKMRNSRAKIVITIYDMIHEKYKEYFPADDKTAFLKSRAIGKADHIICISENTRKDLVEITNIPPSKTSVVHLGSSFKENLVDINGGVMNQPYILFVGHRQGYKNFHRVLQAYASSKRLVHDFNLVCFGGFDFSADELAAINSFGLGPNKVIRFSGSDKALANLYSNAAVLVYPSLYEGFGIPLLEAMSCQCPVVCSKTSSMPEVAGDAAEYFDPYEVGDIKQAIEKIVYSVETSQNMVSRGLARIDEFSWSKCAQETYSIYSSLLQRL